MTNMPVHRNGRKKKVYLIGGNENENATYLFIFLHLS